MTISPKELLRRAFSNGNYDVTSSSEEVADFCAIFAGEDEAQSAIAVSRGFMSDEEISRCIAASNGAAIDTTEADALRGEVERLKQEAGMFCAIHAARQADSAGYPSGHISAHFYDMMAGYGMRVDQFTRVDDGTARAQAPDAGRE